MRVSLFRLLSIAVAITSAIIATHVFAAETKTPDISISRSGNLTNILVVDPDLKKQAETFAALSKVPNSENDTVIPWLIANANSLQPAFLYELARRLWDSDKDKAFEWYAIAMIRSRYDAFRCTDKTAPQGILYLPQIASNVARGIEKNRAGFGSAGARALARNDLFESNVSPWWICSHGMGAISSALQKKPLKSVDWLKPESEWEGLRASLHEQYARFFEEQGKPQDDPIPMTKTAYRIVSLGEKDYAEYTWLDSNQLVVSVNEKRKSERPAKSLAIWRRDGTLKDLVSFGGLWCAGNGTIAYEKKLEKLEDRQYRITYALGSPGRWRDQSVVLRTPFLAAKFVHGNSSGWTLAVNPRRQSPYDCRWVESKRLSGSDNSEQWVPLLPDHGFVMSPKQVDQKTYLNFLYYASDTASPVELPINTRDVPFEAIRYFPYKKAYFISPIAKPPRNGEPTARCTPVWWFWPKESRTEETCVAVDSVNESYVTFAPSKVGLLRASYDRKTPHGPKPGGVYLSLPNDKVEKIFEAKVRDWSVTPDGCAVAVRHAGQKILTSDISVIELCR